MVTTNANGNYVCEWQGNEKGNWRHIHKVQSHVFNLIIFQLPVSLPQRDTQRELNHIHSCMDYRMYRISSRCS